VSLANPEAVPAGRYARAWLEGQGLWACVAERVVPGSDVRAALAVVESGAAPAGVVYATDAATSRRVRVALVVPREAGPPIAYSLALLDGAVQPAAALYSFLKGPEAAAVFTRHGFLLP
jgi:molybdate transport system substrate-binding protein